MEEVSIADTVPAEIYLKIWSYLPSKQVVQLREVCVRWKNIIDELSLCDYFWNNRCMRDFQTIYKSAGEKRRPGMNWSDLYRSLTLWSRVHVANDSTRDLCTASFVNEEIRSLQLLCGRVIAVHNRSSVSYYDIDTMIQVRAPISGNFLKYSENDKVSVVLNYHKFLFVEQKVSTMDSPLITSYDDIKTFLLLDDVLFIIDMDNNLYQCKLDAPQLVKEFVIQSHCGIVSVGYYGKHLHVLLLDQGVYAIINNTLVLVTTLGATSNLMHLLYVFNFTDMIDWRIYFHWMFILKYYVPQGPLEEILIMRIYGDMVFVGCNWGILRIYKKPFVRGQFNIFNSEPIKQYNFMEWLGVSQCTCPIQSIDIQEVKDGHNVYVAMPKKITVISFNHDFLETIAPRVYIASMNRFGIKRMRMC